MGNDIVREVRKIGYPSSKEKEYRLKAVNPSKNTDVKFIQNNRKLFSRGD